MWLFLERFIHYAIMSEHSGMYCMELMEPTPPLILVSFIPDLRHIMGVGISITRGCAAALSFDYSVLLLSMSRNLLTKLKETSLHQYIPTDAHGQFHKVRISWYEQMSFTSKMYYVPKSTVE